MYGKSNGQILLITLLVLSISTTIALSLIGRSRTDITISNEAEESARAFNAAEAGIEEALRSGYSTGTQTLTTSGIKFNADVSEIGAAAAPYTFPGQTDVGSHETLWLVNHANDGSLIESPTYTANSIRLCWRKSTSGSQPAVALSLFYKDGSEYRVASQAYDPDAARRIDNKFSAPASGNYCGQSDVWSAVITFGSFSPAITPASDVLLVARLRPLYAPSVFSVDPGGQVLPSQGKNIESTGTTETGIERKIIVRQQYLAAATIFDNVLFSHSSLTK